jgi:hypothetical protein
LRTALADGLPVHLGPDALPIASWTQNLERANTRWTPFCKAIATLNLDMARQLALWAAVLFAIALIAAAIAPQEETPQAPVFPAPNSLGETAGRAVEGTLPAATPLVADLGTIVRLRVGESQGDHVVISGLGVRAPVGPGTTGLVEFVADSPGRWPVLLDPSGVRIGTVEVQG